MSNVLRIAAFSDGNQGGNPAGVAIHNNLPSATVMQSVAADIGYSETVFAAPLKDGWRVRYFSPQTEVPFCGHATIALGAALSARDGDGIFNLTLNDTEITVEGKSVNGQITAALQSPKTYSSPAKPELIASTLQVFGYTQSQLNTDIPMGFAHAGANHLIVMLNSREALAAMTYDLQAGRKLMNSASLVTVLFGFAETPQLIHTRNPFASGGVYEDPATGAATAALAGYLRDINWPHEGSIDVIQGEDMGMRSLINANIGAEPGSSIRVSGAARFMEC